jgi:hypothetical protein
MKTTILNTTTRALALTVTALALCAGSATATLIDDFSGDLSAYTQTTVLAQSADPDYAFSNPSGFLQVGQSYYTNGAKQDLFLRGDYSLTPGYVLRISAVGMITNAGYADFGIAVASQANPWPAVWTSGTASTRSNYLNVYFKGSYGTVGTIGFDGLNNQMYSNSGLYPTNSAGTQVGYSGVVGLWIAETSTGVYDVGYTLAAGGDILFHTYTVSGAQPGDTSIGAAIGFYGDVRANTSYGGLDDLRLDAIPEPSTCALLGLGGLACACWLRRRK